MNHIKQLTKDRDHYKAAYEAMQAGSEDMKRFRQEARRVMNRFTQMHNDYLDPDKYLNEGPEVEPAGAHKTVLALVEEFGLEDQSIGHLYRAVYNGTACGPTIGVALEDGEMVYCDDLYKIKCSHLHKDEDSPGHIVTSISVSSIVEGVDQTTDTILLQADCTKEKFWKAVEDTNAEAGSIWNDTHGCESCAKHFGVDFDDEHCPVWTDCPDCDGDGIVL